MVFLWGGAVSYERGAPVMRLDRVRERGEHTLAAKPTTPNDDIQGYLAHKKLPPPWDHRGALSIALLYGPRGAQFLMSEVPPHPSHNS